jgi:hypothetical protein
MKKQKMNLDKMKNVLSHVLSREEMKEVMAGSGTSGGGGETGPHTCGYCYANNRFDMCWSSGGWDCVCNAGGEC